jgi:multiple sugar transport system permease protein/raffinose/stachyose/melibiose transport system permease protein
VLNDDNLKTITVGLLRFQSQFVSQAVTQWGPLFAGYVVASLPLLMLFLAASRAFVEGLTAGALKA